MKENLNYGFLETSTSNLLAEVAENDIVKENPDVEIFEEGIIDSFQTVGLLLEIQNKLDIEVSIMDFDRDEWATPNKIVEALEELR
ncbi:D-alanine--poly(phosphoribitol) ligase subunit 2 [Staphylococcus aureus]